MAKKAITRILLDKLSTKTFSASFRFKFFISFNPFSLFNHLSVVLTHLKLKVNVFNFITLVYCFVDKTLLCGSSPSYKFKQNVAAKYMSMKLIC